MSPITVTKRQPAPKIEPGTYTLELVGVRETQARDFDDPSKQVDRIELTLVICDEPFWQGKQFTDLCTPMLGERSKLGQIMTALNAGNPLPEGEHDLENYIGRRMRASIRRKDTGYNQIIGETAVPVDLTEGRNV